MIIYTIALRHVSHCMMNKTTQFMLTSLVEKVGGNLSGQSLWKANCKDSKGIHHLITSLDVVTSSFIKLIMGVIYEFHIMTVKEVKK